MKPSDYIDSDVMAKVYEDQIQALKRRVEELERELENVKR